MTPLAKLKSAVGEAFKVVEVCGVPLTLCRLSARDCISINRENQGIPRDADGNISDDDAAVAFYLSLLTKTLINPETMEREFDCEEGRNTLLALGNDLFVLGDAAIEINGMSQKTREEAKKK